MEIPARSRSIASQAGGRNHRLQWAVLESGRYDFLLFGFLVDGDFRLRLGLGVRDPSNKRTFVRYDPARRENGVPDGATVDAEGYLWSGAVFSGELRRFAPDGTLDRAVPLPIRNVTSLAFGGPNLDVIYFTSIGQIHLPGLPNDGSTGGSLFAITVLGIQGAAEPRLGG